ncbi:2-keto-3-deoxy-L-rhamnonate aldolase [Collibacillus ludicampi]|jgi:2-keto-3-deoxy-L-rhamnonate aldolase RhmA|uniref:2-keto-3-deoxy-L-rhamnonate aldolase n=1 Tax=Collibacillus ludicampi TaxID=2771369 RepID=A0AAV4LEJ7_9BACL|nr:aldolase/citrate lyase family protein [Collibacillus ludicampi]GIM45867.1 2-keto-3-deoxy-L-rhamnonate aldolase [Collibacillus ludicampi]
MNAIRERLRAGETLYGTWLRIPHPIVMEVLGQSGFDFIHVDMEHGPIGTGELGNLLLAAKAVNTPAIVRLPGKEGSLIGRTLDMGASGVIIPQVNNGEEAAQVIKAARFHPLGKRGMGGACRADGYGKLGFHEFASVSNEQTLLVLQIETKEAVERLDEILDISGDSVDVFYIGPADLSQSLGIPGNFDDSLFQRTLQWVVKRVRSRGKILGIHAASVQAAKEFAALGIQYINCSIDIELLVKGAKELAEQLKEG